MKEKSLRWLLVLVSLGVETTVLWAQSPTPTKTWNAGTSGTWGSAANWSGGTLPTTSDVVALDGTSSITLDANYTVNSVVFNHNNANTVTLYLNGYTLNISGGSLNFGQSAGATTPSNVNIVGPGAIVVTGYMDANEKAINTINLYNGVTISVSGTFWGNQNPGTSTTFNGDGSCSLSAASMSGSGYNIIFNNMTITTGGVTYYSPTTSAAPAAGQSITVTVTGTFSSGTQFRYTTTYRNTNATTTEQYNVAGTVITSSVGATNFPTTSGAGTFSFTIGYPATVDAGDGLNVSLLAPNGFVLGTISFTQPSATTWTWDGDTSTDWSNGNNWDVGTVPTTTSVVVIPAGTTYSPVLTAHGGAASVTVNAGASLDLNGYNLTGLSTFTNNGTVRLRGTETVGGTKVNGSNSTVEYYGSAAMPVWGSAYQNLVLSAGAALSLTTVTATVAGDCNLAAGSNLTLGANNLTINGTLSNAGTIIISGAGRPNKNDTTKGTVRYTVAGGTISDFGATDYFNLELNGAGAFTAATPMAIANALTVTNSSGVTFQSTVSASSVTLTNTTAGQTIDFQGAASIGSLTTAAQGYHISFGGGGTITNSVTFTNTGTVTLGNDGTDSITFTNGVTATAPSQINLGGTIASGGGAGQNISLGDADTPVVLIANTMISTGAGSINLGGSLSGAYTLNLSAPGGAITLVSTNGTPTGLTSTSATFTTTGSVTVSAGSAITITADQIAIGGTLGNSGAGTITLQPAADGTSIGLNDPAGTFNLTATELGYLTTTGTVTIGRTTGTGAVTIGGSGNTNLSSTTYNLMIEGTSSPVSFSASTLTLGSGKTLTFSNGGNVVVAAGATHVSIGGASTVAFSQVGSVGASGAALATD
ncbi:MAG: hypothetical protein N2509_06215, partial [Treponemataceae bacterium]|nr:hypothetical protein [Treponemataceae bacterium]